MKNKLVRWFAIPFAMILMAPLPAPAQHGARKPSTNTNIGRVLNTQEFTIQKLEIPHAPGTPFNTVINVAGQPVTFHMRPHSPRTSDFQFVRADEQGVLHPVEAPPPSTYRGEAVEARDTRAVASVSPSGLLAYIAGGPDLGGNWQVTPLREFDDAAARDLHVVYRVPEGAAGICNVEKQDHDGDDHQHADIEDTDDVRGGVTHAGTRFIRLAVDSSYSFYLGSGSNPAQLAANVEFAVEVANDIFEPRVQLSHRVSFLVYRDTSLSSGIYNYTDDTVIISNFRAAWNASPFSSVRRGAAFLFLGHTLSGGVLGRVYNIGTVCNESAAYGLAAPWPSDPTNLYLVGLAAAHELGHLWNAQHCNGTSPCYLMCPVIGSCDGFGPAPGAFGAVPNTAIINYSNSSACNCTFRDPMDFNGDRHPDLFFRSALDGAHKLVLMNGYFSHFTVINHANEPTWPVPLGDTDWGVAAIGDFNRDGHHDIMFRNRVNGHNRIWLMNNTWIIQIVSVDTAHPAWYAVGVGDFNNDGINDLLWRNRVTGENAVWMLDGSPAAGSFYTSSVAVATEANTNIRFKAVGDFDRSGTPDIYAVNAVTGAAEIWRMNGTTVIQKVGTQGLDPTWHEAGEIADFEFDGDADVILQRWLNGDSEVTVMNQTTPLYNVLMSVPGVASHWWLPARFRY